VSRAFGDGDYPEALSIIDEVLTVAPDDADLLGLRAYTLALLGEPTRAENDLLRAVELRPGWFETE
jgi:Flp pilus assembly protein TadD